MMLTNKANYKQRNKNFKNKKSQKQKESKTKTLRIQKSVQRMHVTTRTTEKSH